MGEEAGAELTARSDEIGALGAKTFQIGEPHQRQGDPISERIISITALTPRRPDVAKPKAYARPSRTMLAPSATALVTSEPAERRRRKSLQSALE